MLPMTQQHWDSMVNQISTLTSELAALRANPNVTIADKVKLPMPQKFKGERDGDAVRNFCTGMDNWFELVG